MYKPKLTGGNKNKWLFTSVLSYSDYRMHHMIKRSHFNFIYFNYLEKSNFLPQICSKMNEITFISVMMGIIAWKLIISMYIITKLMFKVKVALYTALFIPLMPYCSFVAYADLLMMIVILWSILRIVPKITVLGYL